MLARLEQVSTAAARSDSASGFLTGPSSSVRSATAISEPLTPDIPLDGHL
jgi:hypothetical protein